MKKRIKKLSLNRETLRTLQDQEVLEGIAGGRYETSSLCRDMTFCGCNDTQSLCTASCNTRCY